MQGHISDERQEAIDNAMDRGIDDVPNDARSTDSQNLGSHGWDCQQGGSASAKRPRSLIYDERWMLNECTEVGSTEEGICGNRTLY